MEKIGLLFLGTCFGFILSLLQFKYIWINQKRLEEKIKALNECAKALALFRREALDPDIQTKKRTYDGIQRIPELTLETDVLITTMLVKTKALFSESAYKCLDSAFKIKLDFKDPSGDHHHEFIEQSEKAIGEMNKDI